jgi:hypothetical protein
MKAIVMTGVVAATVWVSAGGPAWAGHSGSSWSIQIGSGPVYARSACYAPVVYAQPVCAAPVVYRRPACAPVVVYQPVVYRGCGTAYGRGHRYRDYQPVGWGRYQPVRHSVAYGRPIHGHGRR